MKDDGALERFLARAEAILHGHDDESSAGTRIGTYRLLRRLGQGGMGVVWLAEDTELKRLVAVKLLASHMTVDREAIWRFGQEATAAARLEHPHIVAVHTAGEEDGVRYLVMDYVDGLGLDRLLALLRGRKPHEVTERELCGLLEAEIPEFAAKAGETSYVRRAVEWVRQTAEALQHAHGRGVLHRDIKPSNLLVDRQGRIRIVDFGLARVEEAAPVTRTGAILGTLTYMAPESLAGKQDEVDARADVYALGAVLFELLAFRPPFIAASLTGLVEEINREIPARLRRFHPGLPRDLELITGKCLAKERAHRYATARDLADDLRRFLEGKPVRARPASPARKLRYWTRRNPGKATVLAVAVLLLAGTGPALRALAGRRATTEAAAERRRAADKQEEHERLRGELAAVRAEYVRRSEQLQYRDELPERNAGLVGLEQRVLRYEVTLARLLEEARGALERAARLETPYGGPSEETRAAFARYFLFRFERAVEERDAVRQELFAAEVRRYDETGAYIAQMEAPGTLTILTRPAGAEVFLFRYVRYEKVREGVVPRLVPVPVSDRKEWAPGFGPGDPCLVVTAVTPGTPAARAGLAPGDLVVRSGPTPCGGGVFVTGVTPGGMASKAGVERWDWIGDVDGKSVRTLVDWNRIQGPTTATRYVGIGPGRRRLFLAGDRPLAVALGIEVAGPAQILETPAPAGGATLTVLHEGSVTKLRVPGGETPGLAGEITAYPLILSAEHRVPVERRLEVAAGSYLLLARRAGYEDQRFPVVVARGKDASPRLELLPKGTTPPGFVWIPPGPCLIGGDPQPPPVPAAPKAAFERITLEGFFIRRTEVTTREWFQFLNDPATRAVIEKRMAEGNTIYVPRHFGDNPPLYGTGPDGRFLPRDAPDTPIRGINGEDVRAFVAWHNARAQAAGEAWLWAVPSGAQWQKAARGADGRYFPWGNRYDADLFHNHYCRTELLANVPSRFEPRDESPFGVADLAGSRREWTGAGLAGSSWGDGDARYARASFFEGLSRGYVNWTCGFRPVLRPNPDAR